MYRILHVDDKFFYRDKVKSALSLGHSGEFDLVSVGSLADAKKAFYTNGVFDLVLCDMTTEELNDCWRWTVELFSQGINVAVYGPIKLEGQVNYPIPFLDKGAYEEKILNFIRERLKTLEGN